MAKHTPEPGLILRAEAQELLAAAHAIIEIFDADRGDVDAAIARLRAAIAEAEAE